MDEKEKNVEFLQSAEWRKFQQVVGHRTFSVEESGFSASIIEHALPIVGKYFYIPRGPIMEHGALSMEQKAEMQKLIELAEKEKAGWIRFDANNARTLDFIRSNWRVVKAPHDMQPREIFVVDITKPEEQMLAEMKPKTRYNINLSQKHGVSVKVISNFHSPAGEPNSPPKADPPLTDKQYVDAFLELTKEMAARQGIAAHPEEYYRKMTEVLPENMLKMYVAEYEGKIIAANMMLFYGNTATYLHGASGSEHRNAMAPFLLQWQAILDAKKMGCVRYDFGGVKTQNAEPGTQNNWEGITKFKTGFSPNTKPIVFPGSYDIVVNPWKYAVYSWLQGIKAALYKLKKF